MSEVADIQYHEESFLAPILNSFITNDLITSKEQEFDLEEEEEEEEEEEADVEVEEKSKGYQKGQSSRRLTPWGKVELTPKKLKSKFLQNATEGKLDEIKRTLLSYPGMRYELINCVDNYKRTPLYLACKNGSVDCFKFFLEQEETEVDALTSSKYTAFSSACLNGRVEILILFLNHWKSIFWSYQVPDIFFLILEDDSEKVKSIIRNFPEMANATIRDHPHYKETAIFIASACGLHEIVDILASSPMVDLNWRNISGCSPLYVAAQNGHALVVRVLLKYESIHPSLPNDDGLTPLMTAIAEEKNPVIDELLNYAKKGLVEKKRIGLEVRDKVGNTCISIACQTSGSIVETLIGLDLNHLIDIPDENGFTPLMIACQFNQIKAVDYLIKQSCINNIDINKGNKFNATALYIACQHQRVEIVQKLIEMSKLNGFTLDLNKRAVDDTNPLMVSCINGNLELVKILKEAGADFKVKRDSRYTLAHLAVEKDHTNILDYLLTEMPDFFLKNEDLLSIGCHFGCLQSVEILFNHLKEKTTINYRIPAIALTHACKMGHYEIVEKFYDCFDENNIEECISCSIKGGHYLITHFLFEKNPMITVNKMLKMAYKSNKPKMLQYLICREIHKKYKQSLNPTRFDNFDIVGLLYLSGLVDAKQIYETLAIKTTERKLVQQFLKMDYHKLKQNPSRLFKALKKCLTLESDINYKFLGEVFSLRNINLQSEKLNHKIILAYNNSSDQSSRLLRKMNSENDFITLYTLTNMYLSGEYIIKQQKKQLKKQEVEMIKRFMNIMINLPQNIVKEVCETVFDLKGISYGKILQETPIIRNIIKLENEPCFIAFNEDSKKRKLTGLPINQNKRAKKRKPKKELYNEKESESITKNENLNEEEDDEDEDKSENEPREIFKKAVVEIIDIDSNNETLEFYLSKMNMEGKLSLTKKAVKSNILKFSFFNEVKESLKLRKFFDTDFQAKIQKASSYRWNSDNLGVIPMYVEEDREKCITLCKYGMTLEKASFRSKYEENKDSKNKSILIALVSIYSQRESNISAISKMDDGQTEQIVLLLNAPTGTSFLPLFLLHQTN